MVPRTVPQYQYFVTVCQETRAARRFSEAKGLMGSESSVPNLFGGQKGSETIVGQILGNNVGRFGSGFDEPAASNDPLA
jgi:hypothetical protein